MPTRHSPTWLACRVVIIRRDGVCFGQKILATERSISSSGLLKTDDEGHASFVANNYDLYLELHHQIK